MQDGLAVGSVTATIAAGSDGTVVISKGGARNLEGGKRVTVTIPFIAIPAGVVSDDVTIAQAPSTATAMAQINLVNTAAAIRNVRAAVHNQVSTTLVVTFTTQTR